MNLLAYAKEADFTDPRDGEIYKTVEIGTQIWMAENLRHHCDSVCLNYNLSSYRDNGYLYNWKTAMAACPGGWHLPRKEIWNETERLIA